MKITVVGAGMVGIAVCNYALTLGTYEELVLIDINQERVVGELLDFGHTQALTFTKNTRLIAGDYHDAKNSDIVVITAGVQIKEGQTRDALAQVNAPLTVDIARQIEQYAPDATLILVTNPVDLATYFIISNTRFPPHKVISAGCVIDTARFMKIVADRLEVDPKNVFGYVLGEHGVSSFIPWSIASIAGQELDYYCDTAGIPRLDHTQVLQEVKQAGFEIFKRKQNTNHGVAASVYRIIQAITINEHSILPVGTLLHGQYGIDDVVLSLPTVVDKRGATRTLIYPFTEPELAQLHQAADHLKTLITQVKRHSGLC